MTIGNIAPSVGFKPQIQIGNTAPKAEEPSFFEQLIDIVNPLQHLPLISNLYRNLTGDEISSPAKLAGGALFGGPLGAAGAAVSEIVKSVLNNETTQTSLASTSTAQNAYSERIRITTADWLNPSFNLTS